MITVYGLKNCDSCRAAMKWLAGEGVEATLMDMRKDGLSVADLDAWMAAVGWETLLNKRGTTWRGLADHDKADLDASKARDLMLKYPALIKRPIFVADETVVVGFKDAQKAALLRL